MPNCYKYRCPVCGAQAIKGYDDRMECWNCWTVFDGSMCRSCPFLARARALLALEIVHVQALGTERPLPLLRWRTIVGESAGLRIGFDWSGFIAALFRGWVCAGFDRLCCLIGSHSMIEKASDYLLKGPSARLYLELHESLPKLLRNPNSLPPRRHHTQISRHIDIKISVNKGAKISY